MILAPKMTQKTTFFLVVGRAFFAPFSRPCPKVDFWRHFCHALAPFWHPFGGLWLTFGSLLAPFGSLLDAFGSLWAPFVLPLAPFGQPFGSNWLPLGALRLTFDHLRAPFSHIWRFLASFWINFLIFQQNLMKNRCFFSHFLQIRRLQHLFSWTRSGNLPQAT